MTRRWTRLGVSAAVGGAALAAFAVWAYARYETVGTGVLLGSLALGAVAAALPRGVSFARLAVRRLGERAAGGGADPEESTLFRSTERVADAEAALDAVAESFAGDDDRSATRKSFADGPGLVVSRDGFHNSFVRQLRSGHLAVTGDGDRTAALADRVERVTGVPFAPTTPSRVASPKPLRGPTRVTVGLVAFLLLLSGVAGTTGAAYPATAYNPAERAVLVSFDARADLDPTMAPADGQLGKSAFLADVLREEAVEIRVANGSARIREHAEQSLAVSRTAEAWLDGLPEASLAPARRARAERIRSDLRSARGAVADAIAERTANASAADAERLRRIRATLLRAA